MSYRERLKKCTYTSPSGRFFDLEFEDLIMSLKKKTSIFEFLGSPAVYVQDNNIGARTIPITVYFSGDDHDLQANTFLKALSEIGAGKLQHPLYGLLTVVATGEITRADKLKTAANQSAFTIAFVETITNLYPNATTDYAADFAETSKNFNSDAAAGFANNISIDTQTEKQSLINQSLEALQNFKGELDKLAAGQAGMQTNINDIFKSITGSIDILIGDPLTLAFQTVQMVKSVVNSSLSIVDRLGSYNNLLADIVNQDTSAAPSYNHTSKNKFANDNLYARATVSAMCDSVYSTKFKNREDAINAAQLVTTQFYNYTYWHEKRSITLAIEDVGDGYQYLEKQIALSGAFLIDLSLSLDAQKTVTIDKDMFLIDFCYTYLKTIDNQYISDLINLNGLNNREIWTLPKHKIMKYYEVA